MVETVVRYLWLKMSKNHINKKCNQRYKTQTNAPLVEMIFNSELLCIYSFDIFGWKTKFGRTWNRSFCRATWLSLRAWLAKACVVIFRTRSRSVWRRLTGLSVRWSSRCRFEIWERATQRWAKIGSEFSNSDEVSVQNNRSLYVLSCKLKQILSLIQVKIL